MRKGSIIIAMVLGLSAVPAAAQEMENAEGAALGRCMLANATNADRDVVTRWFSGALASASAVSGIVSIDASAKDLANRDFAALLTRLLTVDCLDSARTAVQHNKNAAMKVAIAMLSRSAVDHTLNDPAADDALGAFHQYMNRDKLKALHQ